MKNADIIEFIERYMNRDICKGALMLTGKWGTGKSYFIQNELIKELEKNNKKSIVISLYGIDTSKEISKIIYFESRTRALKKHACQPKVVEAIKKRLPKQFSVRVTSAEVYVAGKVVFNNIINSLGVDLSIKDKDLEKIYNSIDLKDTLVILEDLERSKISIEELLGYVNNLIEQANVKVLLVANEEEYLKYERKEVSHANSITGIEQKSTELVPTSDTEKYLKIKEKTINDTIFFEGDYSAAIAQIMQEYNNVLLNKFSNKDSWNDILDIMRACRCFNLRSFTYACQKTVDIFDYLAEEYKKDDDFLKSIFYGNISYILRIKDGKTLEWKYEQYYSDNLGLIGYPLFKFCYDYINSQPFDYAIIYASHNAFIEYRKYDGSKSNGDKDLSILANYTISQDNEVHAAVNRITKRLENQSDLSFYVYGNIAVYLIYVEHFLGCSIEEAKALLVRNLEGEGKNLVPEQIFRIVLGNDATIEMHQEYDALKKDMIAALKKGLTLIPNFDYLPNQADIFCKYVQEHEGNFHINEGFARNLDMYKFAKMFSECSNEKKDIIRISFCSLYNSSDSHFFKNDFDSIVLLKELLTENRKETTEKTVARLQYNFFLESLNEIIEELR